MGIKAGDMARLTFRGVCFGQRIMLTHTVRALNDYPDAGSVEADLDNLIDSVIVAGTNDILTPYLHVLPPQYTMTDIRAQRFRPTRSAYRQRTLVGVVGTNGNDATVANDSACVTLRTAFSDRDQVANKHIGPIPDNVSAAGLITVGFTAFLATLGTTLATTFSGVGTGVVWIPIIFHKDTNQYDQVTGHIVGAQSRVQRRRTVGLGE